MADTQPVSDDASTATPTAAPPAAPAPAAVPPRRAARSRPPRARGPALDVHSATYLYLSGRFRAALAGLLCINLVLYLVESTIGQFSPTGPDMVLLLLGWYAQDLRRFGSLRLYMALSVASLVIDALGFATTMAYIVAHGLPAWLAILLTTFFLIELAFKASSIVHARALSRELDVPAPVSADLQL